MISKEVRREFSVFPETKEHGVGPGCVISKEVRT